jgi:hypothetical protein
MSCERCGPKKARLYRRAIAREAETKNLTRFLTLTIDPSRVSSADQSVDYIRGCFDKFRTYLKRYLGTRVEYITVLELQKSGMAHLHVLIDRFIPKEWIDTAWNAVGGGFTWIKYVDVQRVSAYMSKYLTKDLFVGVPSKKKRISTSRGIHLFQKSASTGWSYDTKRIHRLFSRVFMHSRGKRPINVVTDDAGLKSFEVERIPSYVQPGDRAFVELMRFFTNPHESLNESADSRVWLETPVNRR